MSVAEEEEEEVRRASLGLRSSRVVHAQLAELGLQRGNLLLLQLGVLGHQPQLPPQVLILRTRLLCGTAAPPTTGMHGRSAPDPARRSAAIRAERAWSVCLSVCVPLTDGVGQVPQLCPGGRQLALRGLQRALVHL